MTSSDREILIAIDGKVTVLGARVDALEASMREVREEQRLLRAEISSLTTAVYWVLGAIGIFLGALGVFTALYLWLSDKRREGKNIAPAFSQTSRPAEDFREMYHLIEDIRAAAREGYVKRD